MAARNAPLEAAIGGQVQIGENPVGCIKAPNMHL
jgi:hypothetical protein